jgi:hypothetical protein
VHAHEDLLAQVFGYRSIAVQNGHHYSHHPVLEHLDEGAERVGITLLRAQHRLSSEIHFLGITACWGRPQPDWLGPAPGL